MGQRLQISYSEIRFKTKILMDSKKMFLVDLILITFLTWLILDQGLTPAKESRTFFDSKTTDQKQKRTKKMPY